MIQGTPIYNYSIADLKADSKRLAQKIGIGKYKFILAITKGGLLASYFLADNLDIKVIKTICLSSYKNKGIQGPIIHHSVEGFNEEIKHPEDWIIIDDLSDTGFTIEYLRKKYPRVKIATLLQKRTGGYKPDYYSREIDNIWVQFPRENI